MVLTHLSLVSLELTTESSTVSASLWAGQSRSDWFFFLFFLFFISLPHQMHPTCSLDHKKFCSYCCWSESFGQHWGKKADMKIHVSPQFLPLIISHHYTVHMALLFLQHGNTSVTVSEYQSGFSLLHYDQHRSNQNSPRYTFNTMPVYLNFGCLCKGHVGGVWSWLFCVMNIPCQ